MPNYKRASFPGGYYFFTVVTYKRRTFLTSESARDCLRHATRIVRKKRPFDIYFCKTKYNAYNILMGLGKEDVETRIAERSQQDLAFMQNTKP